MRAERSVHAGDTSEEIFTLVLDYTISLLNYEAYLMANSGPYSNGSTTHIPTSRVAFEDVVKLAIDVFGARPDKTAWESIIDKTRSAFHRFRRPD